MASWLNRIVLVLLAGLTVGASCGQTSLSILPGVVNDPSNRTLRRELFRFATSELCSELLSRSVPIKLRDEDPSIGRFFPTSCNVQELANEKNLFVQLGGHGYLWNDITGRMGFEATAAVEYEHDFLMKGATMYVYFRQRHTQSSAFEPLMVERGGAIDGVALVLGTDAQTVANQVGDRILQHQLARGFTVVREKDGAVAFRFGVLERGQRPLTPFGRGESDWLILANDRVELHPGQLDLTGPYTIEDEGDALWLTTMVEGAGAVDVLLYGRPAVEPWLAAYERQATPPPPPRPFAEDVARASAALAGRPPQPYRRPFVLPPGQYFIAFDHSAMAGQTTPQAGGDRAALVSYAVQLGEAP